MKISDIAKASKKLLTAPLIGYPASVLSGSTVVDNLTKAEIQSKTLSLYLEKYSPDVVFPFMDLSVEAEALGLKVDYNEYSSPDVKVHPVKSADDLDFKIPDPKKDGRMKIFLDTIYTFKKKYNTMLCGYIISPFTFAGLLMGAENLAINTVLEPDLCSRTIDFALKALLPYAKTQQEQGADFIALLDPTAVLLSPKLFDVFVKPYVQKFVEEIDIPVVLHICGQSTNIIPNMCKTGVGALSLDSQVDFKKVSELVPDDIVLIGNVPPVEVMSYMQPKQVFDFTSDFINNMRGVKNFILSTGCDVPYEAPLENIDAFMRASREN